MFPTSAHRIRILVVGSFLLAGLVALAGRLYVLHVFRHDEYATVASRMHDRKVTLPATRGVILDAKSNVLAHSISVRTIAVDPQFIREEAEKKLKAKQKTLISDLVQILSEGLLLPKSEIMDRLKQPSRYVVLKKKVSDETARKMQDALAQKRIRGVIFEDEQMRFYPNGSLMSHVLGYVNAGHTGVDGVEYMMQADLRGQDGWRKIECDSRGREIVVFRNEDFPARNGYNVLLSLDQAIQNIVEQELDKAVQKIRPDSAVIIVMRPSTGEILALANRPTYDPNAASKKVDTLRNRAISDLVEPGSTFKIVTIASALDQRIIDLQDTFWCENGRFLYEGRYITDHHPAGTLDVTGILVHSSNVGSVKIALMLGSQKMYQAMARFGFGQRAWGDKEGERWLGEIRGIVRPLRSWSKLSLSRLAMGYEVGVTPLQMVTAMSALANGGNLMRPMIVKRVQQQDGTVVREFFPEVRRRVVDQKAARDITKALTQVVSKEGTAAKAAIPGYHIAGKTGTAHIAVNGQYSKDQYISSFCGYFPAEEPEVCIYVMFNRPRGKEYFGGAIAAPLFKSVGERVASYLHLRPTVPIPPTPEGRNQLVSMEGGT
jgi:cell division protein FtsI/penicillin-binding protein 2